jgi:integrase
MLASAWCSAPEPARRLHDLRHSYAICLVSNGVPVNVVSRLTASSSTTLDRYTHDARDYADLRVRQVVTGLNAGDLLTSGRE